MGVQRMKSLRLRLADMIGHYKRSKFMAEQVAFEAAKSGGDVVIVNPTTPIGERDIKPTPTGRIVVDFLKRKFPAYVETGLNLVDARNARVDMFRRLKKEESASATFWGRESYAEADSGSAWRDHRLEVADSETALFVAFATGVVDRDGDRPASGPRAACDH